MLNFAYGSNLDKVQFIKRCKSAKFISIASLKGYQIAFTRESKIGEYAVADVVKKKDSEVWGVIYEISEKDCNKLDKFEGYIPEREKRKNCYNREIMEVLENGDPNKLKKVSIYIAVKQENPGLPSKEYLDHILRGARHFGLPPDYIQRLERWETND